MAGIFNKDRDFWDYIESMDFVSLSETWVEERSWNALRVRLSEDFLWDFVAASRDHKKGRAKGGVFDRSKEGVV